MQAHAIIIGALIGVSASFTVMAARPAVPQAVQVAIARLLGDAAGKVEVEDGRYEVSAATRLEVVLDARGVVEEIEVKLPLALVPAPIVAAARAALPGGARLEEAELLIRGSALLYEIEARTQSGEVEVVLDSAGKVVSQATEPGDEDGAEDD